MIEGYEDYHTHNKFCRHASGTIEDYVINAIEKGLSTLGISDHFPYDILEGIEGIPYEEYSMKFTEIQQYIHAFKNSKKKFNNKINLKFGFEVDFIEQQERKSQEILKKDYLKNDLDYILGSVHVLQADNFFFAFDDRRFLDFYNHFGGIDNLYIKYYETLRKMLDSSSFDFDIVTHFDLPKKYNKRPQNRNKVEREVDKTLKLIKKKDKTIEINTSGLRKEVEEIYPSDLIIQNIYELNIPIILGSDAHDPSEVAHQFESTLEKLKTIGFTQLAHFERRKRTFKKIL